MVNEAQIPSFPERDADDQECVQINVRSITCINARLPCRLEVDENAPGGRRAKEDGR